MDDHVDGVEINELSVDHKATSEKSANLLEEIKELDKQLRDSNYKLYKKSRYWHQQTGIIDEVKQETFQKELMERLQRIEAILMKIETSFEK